MSLSGDIVNINYENCRLAGGDWVRVVNVKQFIKEIKEELCQRPIGNYKLPCGICINCKIINGEAGEALI